MQQYADQFDAIDFAQIADVIEIYQRQDVSQLGWRLTESLAPTKNWNNSTYAIEWTKKKNGVNSEIVWNFFFILAPHVLCDGVDFIEICTL